ncbi:hypothetical protein A1F99_059750 [Pyrenophora tritici-repentis]|nr:hypothetical protein A1F99_059750 [Pyrenophora tritici-repentis]
MSETPRSHYSGCSTLNSLDAAEKGIYDSSVDLPAPGFVYLEQKGSLVPAASPVHQGITPCTSVSELSLALPVVHKPADTAKLPNSVEKPIAAKPKKPEYSRWLLFDLWFNTYRKFFVVVVSLNLTGIILAGLNRFPYAENHLGALVLGNMLTAVLVRNELWMRLMYLLAIYGLGWAPVCVKLAATSALQHVGGIHSGCALSGTA